MIPSRSYHVPIESITTTIMIDTSDLGVTHETASIDTHLSEDISLPTYFNHLGRVDQPLSDTDVPFLFHIPRSGGSTLNNIMSSCLGLVGATDIGTWETSSKNVDTEEVASNEVKVLFSKDGSRFINFDFSTVEGIHQIHKINPDILSQGSAQYLSTPHIHLATELLFSPTSKGRLFTILRNPIDRFLSIYHHIHANWESTHVNSSSATSLQHWMQMNYEFEDNSLTRYLSNEFIEPLTRENNLEIAKKVLKNYCLIGLLERKEETWARLESYFGWKTQGQWTEDCKERYLEWGWANKHSHASIDPDSRVYELLLERNKMDMDLYQFAVELFQEQSSLVK